MYASGLGNCLTSGLDPRSIDYGVGDCKVRISKLLHSDRMIIHKSNAAPSKPIQN